MAPRAASTCLTLREIENELSEVTGEDWYPLGIQLGLRPATLREIQKNYLLDTERCRREVLDLWLHSTPEASRKTLAQAVQALGKYTSLAQKLRRKIPLSPKVPSAPTIVSVEATSSTSISVQFAASKKDGGSPITGYIVEYHVASDPASSFETQVVAIDVFSTTLNSLTPSTEYEMRVRGENAVGHSVPSVLKRAKTDEERVEPVCDTMEDKLSSAGDSGEDKSNSVGTKTDSEVERGDTVKEAEKDKSISAGDSKEDEADPGIQQEEGEIVKPYLMLHEIMKLLKTLRGSIKENNVDSFHRHLDQLERVVQNSEWLKKLLEQDGILCYPAYIGSNPMVETLIQKGVDINAKSRLPETPYSAWEATPLLWAASEDHLNTVKSLIEKGANLHSKDMTGRTALHMAAREGYVNTVKYLIKKGASIDSKDDFGWTPLYWATMGRHMNTVICLVEEGADIHSKDDFGRTPLHWATDHVYTLHYLVGAGGDIHSKDNCEMTPLHWAAKKGRVDAVQYLVWIGANINIKADEGRTPLHHAAASGHAATAQVLVENGADINVEDTDGRTPLDWAAQEGHEEVVACLKRAADPNMLEEDKYTGRQHEQRQSSEETVPAAPTILAAEATSSTSISVKWAASTNNGGSSITGYLVEYRPALDLASPFETHLLEKDVFSTTLNSLASSTEYEVRVRVENAVGCSEPSVTMQTKTKDNVKLTYEREMRYGHIATFIAKVLLFGIAGSGKTSTTAILMGGDPPPVRKSTPLMVRPVQVITVLIKELTKWEKKTPEEVLKIVAEIIRSRESYSESQETYSESRETDSKSQETDLEPQETDSLKYQPRFPQPSQIQPKKVLPTLPKSKFDSVLNLAVKEDDFLSLVNSCDPSPDPILKQRWLYIIDSGGQPEFHDMLSIFVQKATTCIFVCRMHDKLDDYPSVDLYEDGSAVGSTCNSRLTNRQIFQKFMCTMRSFNSTKNEDHSRSPPSILLLATHQDLVEGGELPTSLVDGLKAIALPQFRKQLIYCDAQLEKFIFAMNAKKPEDRDRKTADDIRKVITDECPGEKVNIPIRWHSLDHQSRKISERLNRKVLSREEYGKIAKELNINDESCEGALEFFNSLNTISYFPKVLPDVVFLEPQILLNLLNELVAKKYRADQHAIKPKKSDFQFHDVAQVTEKVLSEFKEHYHPPLFTARKLAKLFEKLLIFGKLEERTWFVPSILPSLKGEEVEQYRESKEKALLIHFPDGGPQNGIFCSTVSFLLSTNNTSPGPWRVLKDHFDKPKCLTRNVIVFSVGKFTGKVSLIEEWTHFEVHVKVDEDSEGDLWQLVYKAVFSGLTKAAKTHHYSDTDSIPQAAIICHEQDKNHPSTPHPATINCENGKWKWTCTKSQQWGGKIAGNYTPWLNLLSLVDPPQVTQHPASPVFPGSQVVFTIAAITCPVPLRYKWQRDGADLPEGGGVSGTTSTMTITNVGRSDEGTYTCVVSNTAGATSTSNPVQLTVRAVATSTSSTQASIFAMKPTLAQLTMMKTTKGEKIKIIDSVAPQWKKLGALFNFDYEGQTLELIEANNQLKGPVACCWEMFVTWLKGKGREATWEVLIELLDDSDQSELAKQVQTACSSLLTSR